MPGSEPSRRRRYLRALLRHLGAGLQYVGFWVIGVDPRTPDPAKAQHGPGPHTDDGRPHGDGAPLTARERLAWNRLEAQLRTRSTTGDGPGQAAL